MATALTASRSPLSLAATRSPFAVASLTGSRPERRGLSHWMNRVLEELGSLQTSPDPDTVHDLRVAIRRCRSLAAVMEESGVEGLRVREVVEAGMMEVGAVTASVPRGWLAGVRGALRN